MFLCSLLDVVCVMAGDLLMQNKTGIHVWLGKKELRIKDQQEALMC